MYSYNGNYAFKGLPYARVGVGAHAGRDPGYTSDLWPFAASGFPGIYG